MSTQHGDFFGRDDLVDQAVREIRKGKHVVLTGPVGVGKSAVLVAALKKVEPRQSEWYQFDQVATDAGQIAVAPADLPTNPGPHDCVMVYVSDHQAKGQFVEITRRLLETGILKPSAVGLAGKYDTMRPRDIPWREIRKPITRTSIRDLTQAIIPAIYTFTGRVLVAVDDITSLTPTQQAFWLQIFEHAQVVSCASDRKSGVSKLWWKMTVIEVPPLSPEAAAAIVRDYIALHGMLIEAPDLYVGHVVKQAGGNPQAIMDMLDQSAKERRVDKRRIREMRHAAGVTYVDFTPVMIIAFVAVVSARYLARGIGDTEMYILASMAAAFFVVLRLFLFRGVGRVTGP